MNIVTQEFLILRECKRIHLIGVWCSRDETVLVTPSETEPDMYCNVVIGHIMLVDLCVDHIKKIV